MLSPLYSSALSSYTKTEIYLFAIKIFLKCGLPSFGGVYPLVIGNVDGSIVVVDADAWYVLTRWGIVRSRGVVDVVITALDRGGLTALDRWMRDFIVVSMLAWVSNLFKNGYVWDFKSRRVEWVPHPGTLPEQVTRPDLSLFSLFLQPASQSSLYRCAIFLSREQCIYQMYAKTPLLLYDYHCNHSPYIFGLSARIYPSNDLFMTVAQLKSTSSSISSTTVSVFSLSSESSLPEDEAFCASRNAFSPLMNRGPRSGKLREGSNGSHLLFSYIYWCRDIPEIMEMVRVGTTEESIETELLSSGSIELVIGEEDRESDNKPGCIDELYGRTYSWK